MIKKKLLIATHNKAKVHELTEFFSDLPLEIVSLSDVNITDDVEEDGATYEENSQKKARFYAELSGLPVVSDDGGIEIAALNNEPGVKSKRWLGYDATEEELLEHMKKVAKELPDTNRNAQFRLVLSFALPDGRIWSVTGEVKGIIAKKPLMNKLKGFPFRSFFYLPTLKKYYHEKELTNSEQGQFNHRFIAAQKLKPIIIRELNLL